jgi:four helix bundle protein
MRDRVSRFEDLDVYKTAYQLQQCVFAMSREWPKGERFSLTDQIRRSSRSVGASIAEAWAKRRYEAHFVSKLTDADGEANETRHWLRTALDCGYIERPAYDDCLECCLHVGAMIGSMVAGASRWAQRTRKP